MAVNDHGIEVLKKAGRDPLGTKVNYQHQVAIADVDSKASTANTTTTNLAGGAVFTGVAEDVSNYTSFSLYVFASHDSIIDGLELQWSHDISFTSFRREVTSVTGGSARAFRLAHRAKYFRIKYTNGASAQTSFVLGVVHNFSGPGVITKPIKGTLTEENFAQVVQSCVAAKKTDGTFSNVIGMHVNGTSMLGTVEGFPVLAHEGHGFYAATNTVNMGSTAEAPLLLIRNPTANTFDLHMENIVFGVPDSGVVVYRCYMNATVTGVGNPLTPVGARQTNQSAATCLLTTQPTVSANGSLFLMARGDQNAPPFSHDFNLGKILEPNNNMLITAQQSLLNVGGFLNVEYAEV